MPPDVFTNAFKPMAASASRMPNVTVAKVFNVHDSPGSTSKNTKSGSSSDFTRDVHACSTIEARLATYARVASSLHTTYVTFFPPSADDAVTRSTQFGTPFGSRFSKNEKPSIPSG